MRFRDRKEAGERLAQALLQYKNDTQTIVYALPRGGVVVGAEVAKALYLPLELVIARKIGHPDNPEYAVCAVTEEGPLLCNEVERPHLDPVWLERAEAQARAEARRRRLVYLGQRSALPCENRTALVVDDGVATGLTLQAAVVALRQSGASQVVIAVPVIPRTTALEWRKQGFTVIALEEAAPFLGGVGAYYHSFPQVEDREVKAILAQIASPVAEN